jgi:hypothetical protein
MKKTTVLMAMFCLCFQAITVLAATPNFSGNWELDVNRSTLPDTMAVEAMTLRVMQTEKEIKIESLTKMNQSQMREGIKRVNGGVQSVLYNLEGKETTGEIGSGMMAGKETLKASVVNDRLNLTQTRNFNNEMGNVAMKVNEIWELLDSGKTLKIMRYSESPRGATNAEMYLRGKVRARRQCREIPARRLIRRQIIQMKCRRK